MTQENYNYRTSPLLLRNQFDGADIWKIPLIPKAEFSEADFENLRLIGFDRTKLENNNLLERMVHFFLYDYKFERVWKSPDSDIEKLRRYRAVLSPDFSIYTEMTPVLQLYNVFRNRWCGAYFASKGMRVVPTVSWGEENTFDFCFMGIPKGSTVAVSTYMVSAHGNHADQKEFFLKGYREMMRRLEPQRIICYNEPFPEMEGNIIFVDYELSSWKYQNDDYVPSKYLPYILGEKPLPKDSGIVIKSGYIPSNPSAHKGMGSAHGGRWTPAKPDDERFVGKPGEIKQSQTGGRGGGYHRETKIGEGGKAIIERHHSVHGNPAKHTDPHDHIIDWSKGFPDLEPPINYPDGAPVFKKYGGLKTMDDMITFVPDNRSEEQRLEDNRFKTISEFKWSVQCGAEIEFVWKDKTFGIFSKLQKTPDSPIQILITQVLIDNPEATEGWYDTPDEALEYVVDGERLRDIITRVEVTDRTI